MTLTHDTDHTFASGAPVPAGTPYVPRTPTIMRTFDAARILAYLVGCEPEDFDYDLRTGQTFEVKVRPIDYLDSFEVDGCSSVVVRPIGTGRTCWVGRPGLMA